MTTIEIVLNGAPVRLESEAEGLLLDALRDEGALEVKEGCGVGVCGLCSVLLDGVPVSACLFLACLAPGAEVWTAKGLLDKDPALRRAFLDREAMQCGICTPGQVVAAAALRLAREQGHDEEVASWMSGNLCRCTGYQSIMAAVEQYLADDET